MDGHCRRLVEPRPQGRSFRHPKSITSHAADLYQDYPAAIRVEGCNAGKEGTQLAELVKFLKRKRVIAEYGQVALLLHSVRGQRPPATWTPWNGRGYP